MEDDLAKRIIATLQFFDLQSLPLTLYEVYAFLISHEQTTESKGDPCFRMDEILSELQILREAGSVSEKDGYYCLPGKQTFINQRLAGYQYGVARERRIRRISLGLRFIPFIRGVALAGSQAMGLPRQQSDIDLLVITDQRYMWLARTLLTAYMQLAGVRRHGEAIANRVCLNHYVAGPHLVSHSQNYYTAAEYSKLRPLYNVRVVAEFQSNNAEWIANLFPNQRILLAIMPDSIESPRVQAGLEWLIDKTFGKSLEKTLGRMQAKRIRIQKDIVVSKDELSFHPDSKQNSLLAQFLALQQQK